ncbi:nucleotide exchange factor GrpE [Candidatus Venteria ishoeyi]|uniref:Protein GrpE n=1 Tax=Candidatus Venteria ishoeyi TaxID=1899563 RepID=A0A1H6F7R5_9GAMM|nr:nucleotide exchange factor GrpE [Candidatus Venteria ishoeyi]SEH06172.1 Protein GrpE [Candidatus Venteria ishoeyi]
MTGTGKEQLLAQFSSYLDAVEPDLEADKEADLFSLFTEMAALRNEVKIESRQFKSALEEFKQAFTVLQNSHERLNTELAQSKQTQQQALDKISKTLLLEFLELYDRLDAGLCALNAFQPKSHWFGTCDQEQHFIASIQEGQAMTLQRLEQILATHQVKAIDSFGRILDPHRMKAIETIKDETHEDGTVAEEFRKGFTWNDEVLRMAEVKVVKNQKVER